MSAESIPGIVKSALAYLNTMELAMEQKYKSRKSEEDARPDSIALIDANRHYYTLSLAYKCYPQEDLDIAARYLENSETLINSALLGDWNPIRDHCKENARASFERATFRLNKFEATDAAIDDERDANFWANLAKSLSDDNSFI